MKFEIPSVSSDPDVARERATLARVQAELNGLRERHEALSKGGPPPRSSFDRAVDAALGLDAPDSVPAADQDKAAERVRVLHAALERQRKVVAEVESRASKRIAEQLKPDYVGILKRGAKALSALRQFVIEEREFRRAMIDNDVKFASVIRPMALNAIADETDIDNYARELREHYNIAL